MECERCNGTGEIMTCWDDICNGIGECIHGDGYSPCPTCKGTGYVDFEDEDEDDVRARVDEVNKPKPREKQDKPDLKRIGDNLAAVVRSNHLQGQVDYDFECHVCKCLKAWEELP